jgi:hypothetical protein
MFSGTLKFTLLVHPVEINIVITDWKDEGSATRLVPHDKQAVIPTGFYACT